MRGTRRQRTHVPSLGGATRRRFTRNLPDDDHPPRPKGAVGGAAAAPAGSLLPPTATPSKAISGRLVELASRPVEHGPGPGCTSSPELVDPESAALSRSAVPWGSSVDPSPSVGPNPPVETSPAVEPVEPDDAEDDELFDREWDRPARTNGLTRLLAAALVGVAGFAGGVAVQNDHDSTLATAAAAAFAAARSRTGAPESAAGTATGTGSVTGGPGGAASTSPGSEPIVVGTVASIAGTTVFIRNFAGLTVSVTVPQTALVTSAGLGGLRPGMTVSVTGTKASNGTVTATALTNHPSEG